MRTTYLWLARLISLLVVIQAMTAVFAMAGLFHWVTDKGGTLDEAVFNGWETTPPTFTGAIGIPIHTILGEQVMPALALLLLVVSFFAKVPQGIAIAVAVLVLVVLQLLAGKNASDIPYLGLWHGIGAFMIFGASMAAAMKAKESPVAAAA